MEILQLEKTKDNKKLFQQLKVLDFDFIFQKDNDSSRLFYIIEDEKILGYAVIELAEKACLKKIFVNKKLRNNGFGSILLKYIINWLMNNNFDSLVVEKHKQMNNFLEKQRFVKNSDGFYELGNFSEERKLNKKMMFVSKFAIVINIVLALLKIISGNIFKSVSLISDGLNSLSDLITNILVIIGLKVGENPEDKEHPFGHGKIESVFSVIIGTFIMITAFDIIKENIMGIFQMKGEVITSPMPVIITVIVIIIKVFQLIFMKNNTKDYRGALINSLLEDYKADIVISISVLAGILLSKINPVFDVFVGISVAIYIMYSGYNLIKDNALILLDSQDEELLENVRKDLSEFDEIENAHDFRMTTSGKNIYLFIDVRMDKSLTIDEAHEITNKISKFIKHKYKNIKRVLIHAEPVYNNNF
ncbi:GNAT family N-acetyltransferase [Leptotrichia sp. oral taxon 212]|uniref:GNAT family N-acetyltransferase n=1 Tax=Leptotrichia sp. oral taxon 212 TaxID=712357 RepID=UPI0006A958A6|nr:GNAT family N-acetyltransferase [Leptotrichia sp. oral taxon 212]ALA95756.1 cation transporter [Leptotrichia sp. oral taxon 212]